MAYLKKTPTYRNKPLSDESIHSYGQSILAFCHWLEVEEKIETPITPRFKLPRVEKKFVPTYTSEDVQRLLNACEEGDINKPDLRRALTSRNRAISASVKLLERRLFSGLLQPYTSANLFR